MRNRRWLLPLTRSTRSTRWERFCCRKALLRRRSKASTKPGKNRRIVAREPQNASALYYLGLAEAALGHRADAADLMRRAIDASPGNVDFLANYAKLLVMLERYAEALAICEQ